MSACVVYFLRFVFYVVWPMRTLNQVKKDVEADPGVVGDDFHQRLLETLEEAVARSGLAPEDIARLSGADEEGEGFVEMVFSDSFEPQIKEMAEHLRLSDEYPIPSHRKGLIGAFNRFVKRAALWLKLRTDVQVSQQARFNLATMVLVKMTGAHLDLLKDTMERQGREARKRIEDLEASVNELREKIDRLGRDG